MTPPKTARQHPFRRLVLLGLTLLVVAVVGTEILGEEKIEMVVAEQGMYCRPSGDEMRDRLGAIRTEFLVNVTGVDELEDGYRYWFEKTPQRMKQLAEFIDFESTCCAFLRFDLSVAPGAETVSLTLAGLDGAKQMLESMMTSVEFDWRAESP